MSKALHFPSGDNIFKHWNMRQTQGFKTKSVPHTKQASQTPSFIMSYACWKATKVVDDAVSIL